jgi:hypothetical protein
VCERIINKKVTKDNEK